MDHPRRWLTKEDVLRFLPYISIGIFLLLTAGAQAAFGWPPELTVVGIVLVSLAMMLLIVAVGKMAIHVRRRSSRA